MTKSRSIVVDTEKEEKVQLISKYNNLNPTKKIYRNFADTSLFRIKG